NSYWRWPWWDVQNTSFLSRTQVGSMSYVKMKIYYNTWTNGLDMYDDERYELRSAANRSHSPYDDRSYGAGVEFGTTQRAVNTVKVSAHYRSDLHSEQGHERPDHPTLNFLEPKQEQTSDVWSMALEDTIHVSPDVDIVGG